MLSIPLFDPRHVILRGCDPHLKRNVATLTGGRQNVCFDPVWFRLVRQNSGMIELLLLALLLWLWVIERRLNALNDMCRAQKLVLDGMRARHDVDSSSAAVEPAEPSASHQSGNLQELTLAVR